MLVFYRRTLDGVLRHQFVTLLVFFATMAATRLSLRGDPQGLLPHSRHGTGHGFRRGRPRHLAAGDGAADGGARRGGAGGPRRGGRGLGHGQHGERADRQYRTFLHRAQAARSTHSHGERHHQPLAPEACQSGRREPRAAAVAGHHRRRPRRPRPIPIHAARRQHRRAQRMGAEGPGQAAARCPNSPTLQATSRATRRSSWSASIATRRRASAFSPR